MYKRISRLRHALFGFGLAASLGFGAVEAFAAPEFAAEGARNCNPAACNRICRDDGFTGGVCLSHNKQCVCYQ